MAADPKAELISIISDGLKSASGSVSKVGTGSEKIETLVQLLESQGKGFDADLVDGDWAIVLINQAKKSPNFQKVIGKAEKASKSFENFRVKEMKFDNLSYTPRGNGQLKATVKVISYCGFSRHNV